MNSTLENLRKKYKLSSKSYTACRYNGLRNIDEIIKFYTEHKSFILLKKSDNDIDIELSQLCNSFLKKNTQTHTTKDFLLPEGTLDFLKAKHSLSVRSYNVCKANGLLTIDKILSFYVSNNSFKLLKNCGHKSDVELRRLCELYSEKGEKPISKQEELYNKLDNKYINDELVSFCLLNIGQLDTRSRNAVKNLLELYNYKVHLILKFLYKVGDDYTKLNNIGKKSAKALEGFFIQLINLGKKLVVFSETELKKIAIPKDSEKINI